MNSSKPCRVGRCSSLAQRQVDQLPFGLHLGVQHGLVDHSAWSRTILVRIAYTSSCVIVGVESIEPDRAVRFYSFLVRIPMTPIQ